MSGSSVGGRVATPMPLLSTVVRRARNLADRNVRATLLLGQRSGDWRGFDCRGAVQLTLAPDARVLAPSRRTFIGVPLLGPGTPRDATTVLAVDAGGELLLEGATLGRGTRVTVARGARLVMGAGAYLTDGSRVAVSQQVEIGPGCAISWGVTLLDDDGHGFGPPPYSAPIRLGANVWVGCNVTILKGVDIGEGSVVAAGSVVTRGCPPRSLLAGVPARVVRTGVDWMDAARLAKAGGVK